MEFDSLDRDQFCNAVCQVLDDPNVYSYYKINALQKAQELSSANMAKRMEDLYLEVCAQRPEKARVAENFWTNF